jgi:hypothetical protein
MITREQYDLIMDTHLGAGLELATRGGVKQSMELLSNTLSLAWEVTRPGVQFESVDITDHMPEELRRVVTKLSIHVVIGEGKPIMGFAEGSNASGLPITKTPSVTKAQHRLLASVCDEQLEAHFGHLDMSKVTKIGDVMVEITRDSIDKEVEEFREELDNLFQTWGGGES